MKIKDSMILVTGGASGIGRLISRIALEKGAKGVAIWDINQASLDNVTEEFKSKGDIRGYRVDVSNYDMVRETYEKVKADFGQVDILIQCAGIVTSNNYFERNSIDEIKRMMDINAIAPMYVAKPVLEDMVARDCGHLVNVASAAGMLPNPKMSVYTGSKWAAIGWSDTVRVELQMRKSKVKVTTVAPYYINTGMFDGVQSKMFKILEPEDTARKIVKSIEKEKIYAGIPFSFHFIRLMEGLLPFKAFDWIFGEVCGLYHAMDHFTGRK